MDTHTWLPWINNFITNSYTGQTPPTILHYEPSTILPYDRIGTDEQERYVRAIFDNYYIDDDDIDDDTQKLHTELVKIYDENFYDAMSEWNNKYNIKYENVFLRDDASNKTMIEAERPEYQSHFIEDYHIISKKILDIAIDAVIKELKSKGKMPEFLPYASRFSADEQNNAIYMKNQNQSLGKIYENKYNEVMDEWGDRYEVRKEDFDYNNADFNPEDLITRKDLNYKTMSQESQEIFLSAYDITKVNAPLKAIDAVIDEIHELHIQGKMPNYEPHQFPAPKLLAPQQVMPSPQPLQKKKRKKKRKIKHHCQHHPKQQQQQQQEHHR